MAFSKWKHHLDLQDSPALACPAPVICPAPKRAVIWPELASSSEQSLPRAPFRPPGLTFAGPSAFSVVPQGLNTYLSSPPTVDSGAAAASASVAAAAAAATATLLSNSVSAAAGLAIGSPFFGSAVVGGTNGGPVAPVDFEQQRNQLRSLNPIYTSLMCLPNLLERLQSQNILRSHMSAASYKPIPNNEKVDLGRFRVKDPNEWLVDDVVSWMLDVAKRHNIPFEDLNMHKFAALNGPAMTMLTEQNFIERDPNYGKLIYDELQKSLSYAENTLIDDYMKSHPEEESVDMHSPSTSADMTAINLQPILNHVVNPPTNVFQQAHQLSSLPGVQQQLDQLNSLSQVLTQATFNQNLLSSHSVNPVSMVNAVQSLNQSLASSLAAGLTTSLSPMSLSIIHQNGFSPSSPMLNPTMHHPKVSPLPTEMIKYNPGSVSTDYEDERATSSDLKIRKNKDGKPRKRSQHTKGNKLWEFIRDALKDSSTCPSVVRWEDPIEGVFRIVESEKLAKLWGERKNNTKMTYEKLSRAMRTYYEKQILVPVPKTGLYPKKLVYKFGPGANGWEASKQEKH